MFESDLLERFSRVHPAVPAVLYLPVVTFSLYRAIRVEQLGVVQVVGEFVAGYLFWTLFEYWMHRLIFHMPVVGPKTARAYFLLHGVHHDYPWDATRLVMPPGASLLLCVVTIIAFRAVLGPHFMYGPFAGFVFGYVLYDSLHWYMHHRAPKGRFLGWMRREHLVHHFKDSHSRFGVSCPWLDHVFRTTGRISRAEEEQATREHQEPVQQSH